MAPRPMLDPERQGPRHYYLDPQPVEFVERTVADYAKGSIEKGLSEVSRQEGRSPGSHDNVPFALLYALVLGTATAYGLAIVAGGGGPRGGKGGGGGGFFTNFAAELAATTGGKGVNINY